MSKRDKQDYVPTEKELDTKLHDIWDEGYEFALKALTDYISEVAGNLAEQIEKHGEEVEPFDIALAAGSHLRQLLIQTHTQIKEQTSE